MIPGFRSLIIPNGLEVYVPESFGPELTPYQIQLCMSFFVCEITESLDRAKEIIIKIDVGKLGELEGIFEEILATIEDTTSETGEQYDVEQLQLTAVFDFLTEKGFRHKGGYWYYCGEES